MSSAHAVVVQLTCNMDRRNPPSGYRHRVLQVACSNTFDCTTGGWPNLLQGFVAAVVSAAFSGLVAALTAWLILRGTGRHERRLASELDARQAARTLVSLLGDVATREPPDDMPLDRFYRSITRDFAVVLTMHTSAIALVDPSFSDQLLEFWGDAMGRASRLTPEEAEDPELLFQTSLATMLPMLSNWLRSRNPA